MSTKQKSTKHPSPDNVFGLGKHFAYGAEEEDAMILETYARITRFATGDADHNDRQTMRIRLFAGAKLLEGFEYNPAAEANFIRAMEILTAYNPQRSKNLRKVDVGAMGTLRMTFILLEELMRKSSYWEQVEAIKYGENHCLIDSANYEYELVTVH